MEESIEQATVLAPLALYLWGFVAVGVFLVFRPEVAAALAVVASFLLLPEQVAIDVLGLPPIDKHRLTVIGLVLGCLLRCPGKLVRAKLGMGFSFLILLMLVGGLCTVLTNTEPSVIGADHQPGLTGADLRWLVAEDLLDVGLPFFIALSLFREPRQLVPLLTVIGISALLYSFLALIEVRLSPQLHRWVYGFHQHSFAQTMRDGGFRPMVFTSHGLTLAKFFFGGFVVCLALGEARVTRFGFARWGKVYAFFLYAVLLVSKSLGALLYATLAAPIMLFFRSKARLRLAALFALSAVVIALLRAVGAFPVETLVELAAEYDRDRAQSLDFRFQNEDQLLHRVQEKPWFGWGGFGRNRVRDLETGRDISVTDGGWIITLGTRGVVGCVSRYGLIFFPLWLAWWRRKSLGPPEDQALVATLALILAVYFLDEIPNTAGGLPLFFLAGALAGVQRVAFWRPVVVFSSPPPGA